MRGYFGIGVEGVSKARNMGALMRTAHAFGASFTFSINAHPRVRDVYSADTSKAFENVPYYGWRKLDDMALPRGCQLVGIELTDDAIELPSFRHPKAAAYVLGRERGDLSEAMLERCSHVVKIPTQFCLNVSLAGALVMYDRLTVMGGFPTRPIMPGGPAPQPKVPVKHGPVRMRRPVEDEG
ncbi:MAG: rRNA methyltransferase [Hirschia sp.]|nr:rRNA methyltransferase [Hirschia sp.]MBF18400.1 rRNA methyltransferase [Hirschia sp.]MBF18709.1 rRNA methyltransferase [Hirschia sp.]MBF20321.1 rRNA methyltransferase [Hirschia sp.]